MHSMEISCYSNCYSLSLTLSTSRKLHASQLLENDTSEYKAARTQIYTDLFFFFCK